MQSTRNIFSQMKDFSLSAVVILVGVTIFLALLVALGLFSGGLNCDSYATEQLAEWLPFVAERCK